MKRYFGKKTRSDEVVDMNTRYAWPGGRVGRSTHNTYGLQAPASSQLATIRLFQTFLISFLFRSASLLSRSQMFLRNRRLIYGLVPVRFSYYVPYITNGSSWKYSDGYHLSIVIISVLFNTRTSDLKRHFFQYIINDSTFTRVSR